MLASITPLGQRARGFRFWPTASAYIAASAMAGALVGAALGTLGDPVANRLSVPTRLSVLGVVAAFGLALDLRWLRLRLPTVHRQVNEDWMSRYRGPVFGAGFGFQLGLGVVTIVTTSLVYLTLVAELMAGSAAAGLMIGTVFGLARALPILSVLGVRDAASLQGVQASLARWHGPVRRAAFGLQSAFAVSIGLALLR
jgi:hypothetical protein